MLKKYINLPDFDQLPAPVYFRYSEFEADTHASAHQHAWGSLDYSARGVMRFEVAGSRFMSPPQYAVWIPPNTQHSSYNAQAIVYRSVYLAPALCEQLPAQPCTLTISDILKAILSDFAERDVNIPENEADVRLAQVLVDQLRQAPVHDCFLPYASHPGLLSVLEGMQADPGDNRALAQWAQQVHVSERTLARLFVRELGMSFGEWRQRLRFLASIEALDSARSVQEVAFDLGYSTASAFIAMFQRQAGCTPEQYRRTHIRGRKV
ncbi:helix-turn-helix transcriptional regulator [Pseudomonas sp. P7758]|jgi:AraC-like DNA-binding protein|uniref:AraC family transcriptional regulator n=1 Tax=unclassified Pseudomonas TaxID=196821 RepID=UPI0015A0D74F|nr:MULTISPECIES: helix-turn-helix transcriptional regulator [unclassified Pseudomonas]NWB07499.1 helix-turn-helix transcriptional regulator [Pseudomonas sp. D5002]NWB72208.1 helix-turn-helix transcriptional regulator [Pseudomonas sp. G5001]NWC71266.1 helix-turn-helix transcriptional regulator [Pseudomonas sp. P7758]NWD87792.1 helix-turn-helix transcriptional regulator [Pseudomonas sp. K5002]